LGLQKDLNLTHAQILVKSSAMSLRLTLSPTGESGGDAWTENSPNTLCNH